MLTNFLIIISLFSSFQFKYVGLTHKDLDLDIDNICYYYDGQNNDLNIYVKPCEPSYYCRKFTSDQLTIGTCEKYTSVLKKLNDYCTNDYDCDNGLICDYNLCVVQNNTSAYYVNGNYYCSNGLIPIYQSDYTCLPRSDQGSNEDCYSVEETYYGYKTKKIFPGYFKICGQSYLRRNDITSKYEIRRISSDYIGSVDDGNFVEDIRACRSGYALMFYGNGEFIPPEGELTNNMFQMCVTINEVEKINSYCYINYTLNHSYSYYGQKNYMKNYIYNTRKIGGSSNLLQDDCEFIMTKIKLFKDYLNKMEELKEYCIEASYISEPFTCGNDELRKLWFYYNHIKYYLMYRNDEDVINYLIQVEYPLYGFKSTYQTLEYGFFLNINYFVFILILFIF